MPTHVYVSLMQERNASLANKSRNFYNRLISVNMMSTQDKGSKA